MKNRPACFITVTVSRTVNGHLPPHCAAVVPVIDVQVFQQEGESHGENKAYCVIHEDPAATAAFYKNVFGLTELRRATDTGKDGVWLTDGYIYFAILKHGSDEAPNLGAGPSTVVGVHHIGFYVDDLAEACDTIEQAGGVPGE